MNVTTACLCIITSSLVSLPLSAQSQGSTTLGSGLDVSAPRGHEKDATPGGTKPSGKTRGMPPAGKSRQVPAAPPDRIQAVEERLRSGQMEKPVAQGEISERLNQLHSKSDSLSGETDVDQSSR
jgi:hypothetical protein